MGGGDTRQAWAWGAGGVALGLSVGCLDSVRLAGLAAALGWGVALPLGAYLTVRVVFASEAMTEAGLTAPGQARVTLWPVFWSLVIYGILLALACGDVVWREACADMLWVMLIVAAIQGLRAWRWPFVLPLLPLGVALVRLPQTRDADAAVALAVGTGAAWALHGVALFLTRARHRPQTQRAGAHFSPP